MIKTKQLVEFMECLILPDPEDEEMKAIIIHQLRYLKQLKEEVSNTYAGITSSELFERNDLSG